jgi:hypothetical protein
MSKPKQPDEPAPEAGGPGNPQPPKGGDDRHPAKSGIPDGMNDVDAEAKGRPSDERQHTETASIRE